MGQIYTQAAHVLLWLGPDDQDTPKAVDFLKRAAEFASERTTIERLEAINTLGDLSTELGVAELPSLGEEEMQAASELYARPWFFRVWCVQEASLARDGQFYIGPHWIPFWYLGNGAQWLREIQFLTTGTGAGSEGQRNATVVWQKRYLKDGNAVNILDNARDLRATDPRDKVYGFLGLRATQHGLKDLEPHYDKTVELVYTETALATLRSTQRLDVLACSEQPPTVDWDDPSIAPYKENLPSWVANWNEQTWFPTSAMCMLPMYEPTVATSHVAHVVFSDAEHGTLTLKGRTIDSVIYTAPLLRYPDSPQDSPVPLNLSVLGEIWAALQRQTSGTYTKPELLRALAQTLTGGMKANFAAVTDQESHLADFAAFVQEILAEEAQRHTGGDLLSSFLQVLKDSVESTQTSDASNAQMAMCLMAQYRRLFVTESGHLGLAHSAITEGDMAVFLYGSKLPYMLRRREGHWVFVGEACLYDVGRKAMRSDWSDVGEKDEVFELR